MECIDRHIPCIMELFEMSEATADNPAQVAWDSEEQNVKKD